MWVLVTEKCDFKDWINCTTNLLHTYACLRFSLHRDDLGNYKITEFVHLFINSLISQSCVLEQAGYNWTHPLNSYCLCSCRGPVIC